MILYFFPILAGHEESAAKQSFASLPCKPQQLQRISQNRSKKANIISYDVKSQVWKDPDLSWDTSEYRYDEVVLPVNKIWTPEIHVTNGSVLCFAL